VRQSIVVQNQDTVFQQVWSVRVHLMPRFLQKLTVVGRSYSCTTRYPVCHDHTFTIVRENHNLFHVRQGPLEFFWSRGTFVVAVGVGVVVVVAEFSHVMFQFDVRALIVISHGT
jgi:hypothetical protein